MEKTRSLFNSQYGQWIDRPIETFNEWLKTRNLKWDSMATYQYMWAVFIRWLESTPHTLATLQVEDVKKFVNEEKYHQYSKSPYARGRSRPSRSRYTFHLLRLVEQAYNHMNQLPGAPKHAANPAQLAMLKNVDLGKNQPPSFLNQDQEQRLLRAISSDQEGKEGKENQAAPTSRRPRREAEWRHPRDCALIGVMLGGGLRVSELIGLTISCIKNEDASVIELAYSPKARGGDKHEDKGAGSFGRTIQLEPFAATLLSNWLAIRQQTGFKEDRVFPTRTEGKPLDTSNINRRIRAMLELAGFSQEELAQCSAQTLRNSHAARLLRADWDDQMIMAQMGWLEELTLQRFAVHCRPQKALAHVE